MMHRPAEKETWTSGRKDRGMTSGEDSYQKKKTYREGKEHRKILTGKELEDAGDGEPLAFVKGEELSHKHKNAQDAEYAGEHRAGLHCLEVICRGSQRESNMIRDAVCGFISFLLANTEATVLKRGRNLRNN